MKKLLSLLLVSAITLFAMVGCGDSTAPNNNSGNDGAESSQETTVLRIAAQPFPLYTPIYVAHELGYIEEELAAVDAEYTWQQFQSGPLVNEAIAAGEADLGFMADLPAIIAKSTGQPIEIISNVAYGEKGLAVLVRPDSDIQSVADLKGKKIAYATGSYAAESAPLFGDRKTYQMDFHNRKEGIKETLLDIEEGADIVMVKPAMSYLDMVREISQTVNLPVAAYSVSGEYAMVKAAAKAGCIDEDKIVCEMAASAFRAGADIYITYFAQELSEYIDKGYIG